MARRSNGHGFSIAQLEKMIKTGRTKIAGLERKRATLMRRVEALDAQIVSLGGSVRGKGGRARNEVSLNESIIAVLKKSSGAMQVGDIVKRVLASGYNTTSPNFRGIVNQALIKDNRFAKGPSRGTYLLKK
jgi:hypothetical protein